MQFTESLALELASFNVRAKLVLLGRVPSTSFGDNARLRITDSAPEAHADFTQAIFAEVRDTATLVTFVQDVAEALWLAVTDCRHCAHTGGGWCCRANPGLIVEG